ncbi:MAG TPA: Npt1/Npt2 family nucleotide transporter [Candidatus Obscuribacterales bacterium]
MSNHQGGESLTTFLSVRKGERLITSLLFGWLFLFICVYYVLRPIRRGLFLDGLGNEYMPFVYMGTAAVTGVVVWLYSKFSRVPRRKLIGSVYGIFLANLIAWWEVFKHESVLASGVFWVWLDVFSIMGVTLFWMYANDVFDSAKAKRLFGLIAAGGGFGAILGSSLTASLVGIVGTTNMLLVAAAIVALTLGIFLVIEKINEGEPLQRAAAPEFERCDTSKITSVLKTIVENKFLLFLMLAVAFERVTPDFVQFCYNEILKGMATGRDAIAALDANLERWRGLAELVVDIFLVSFVLKRLGTGFALTSSAATILAGLITFAVVPNPIVIMTIFHLDEGMRHAWFKAAKELTYTVTSRDVLYNVKPVIEMFCYRFARGAAGLMIYFVYSVLGLGTTGVMIAGGACAAGWLYCGLRLSREYKRLELEATKRAWEEQLAQTAPLAAAKK